MSFLKTEEFLEQTNHIINLYGGNTETTNVNQKEQPQTLTLNKSRTTENFLKKSFNNINWVVKKLRKIDGRTFEHIRAVASLPVFICQFNLKYLIPIYSTEEWKKILDSPKMFTKIVTFFWNNSWRTAAQTFQRIYKLLPIDMIYFIFKNVSLYIHVTWLMLSFIVIRGFEITTYVLEVSEFFLRIINSTGMDYLKLFLNNKMTQVTVSFIGIILLYLSLVDDYNKKQTKKFKTQIERIKKPVEIIEEKFNEHPSRKAAKEEKSLKEAADKANAATEGQEAKYRQETIDILNQIKNQLQGRRVLN
jgi:hypothetical protein